LLLIGVLPGDKGGRDFFAEEDDDTVFCGLFGTEPAATSDGDRDDIESLLFTCFQTPTQPFLLLGGLLALLVVNGNVNFAQLSGRSDAVEHDADELNESSFMSPGGGLSSL
jgi:hypothetical protein